MEAIKLSTGYTVEEMGPSTAEQLLQYEHLLEALVMEHHEGPLRDQ